MSKGMKTETETERQSEIRVIWGEDNTHFYPVSKRVPTNIF